MSEHHKLDTDKQVLFYENDFYVLSNFSSFRVFWRGIDFQTSEHAYHFAKFMCFNWVGEGRFTVKPICDHTAEAAAQIYNARSAHEAFKIAELNKIHRHYDWNNMREEIMLDILLAKVSQHEYVQRKLLDTGDRELIEDSWRDSYWGWGPNKDGKNMLGKLWMQIRDRLRKS